MKGHSTTSALCDDSGTASVVDLPEEEDEAPLQEEVAPGEDYLADTELGESDPAAPVVHYAGQEWITGVPTRAQLVARDAAATAAIAADLARGAPVLFMPNDVEETTDYGRARGGPGAFVLRVYGALADGSKAVAVLRGIRPFFDVAVPEGHTEAAFDGHLAVLLEGAPGVAIEAHRAYPPRGYHPEPRPYRRVYTANLQQRKAALLRVQKEGLATASDDASSYYRKAARELELPLTQWVRLEEYAHAADGGPLCAHVFDLDVSAYRAYAPAAGAAPDPLLARDRTLVVGWDLETNNGRGTGEVPGAEHAADHVFMGCLSAHWKDDPEPLVRICVVDVPAAPDARWTTVVCGNQRNLLRALVLCLRALAPDILAGFNDSGYDWPFFLGKLRQEGLLGWAVDQLAAAPAARRAAQEEDAAKWNACQRRVKISAEESMECTYLKVPGCVPIDVRVVYKKLFPKSEAPKAASSLKYYLGLVGLPGKADMPISRMWRIYRGALEDPARWAEEMRHVAHYCVVDATRCQQLLVRRAVVNDYRKVAALAYVAFADSHYNAGGMKVCNLLGARAARRGMVVSMARPPRVAGGKYPGAYVFPPRKGPVPDPIRHAAVDEAAARYREALSVLRATAPDAMPAGAAHEVLATLGRHAAGGAADPLAEPAAAARELVQAFAAFRPDRPVTGLDYSSLYPSIIMTYNLSPEKIILRSAEADYWRSQGRTLHHIEFTYGGERRQGWSVRHRGDPAELGLYPEVLIDLFAQRAAVKEAMGRLGAVKEAVELAQGRARKEGVSLAVAARALVAEAAAESARLEAALAPGAPPPRLPPGSTPAEELADLRRRRKLAERQADDLGRLLGLAPAGAADGEVEAALLAEYDRVSFEYSDANAKQGALKVMMNTFYGEAGNALSPFFLLELACGVTVAGQANLKKVAEFVEGRGFYIKYGDSVVGDTALVVRLHGQVQTSRIDELVPDGGWEPYHEGKEAAVVPGLEIWQDGGFTRVDRVIRHHHEGPITRVLTHTGVVDCTADHSLLTAGGEEVRPGDVRVGDELLHADDFALLRELADAAGGAAMGEGEAFAMGLFAADGSCGEYRNAAKKTVKYSWAINNLDRALLERAAEGLPFPTKILDTVASSGVYKLVPVGGIKGPTLRYRALFYNAHREKRIPPCILGAEDHILGAFWDGFYAGDGHRAEQQRQTSWRVDQKGKEMCMGLWLLGRRLGWEVSLNDRSDKNSVFRMNFSSIQARKRPITSIKKMREVPTPPGFVFDLETESHHFHVGPGNLVVHNTDSLYLVCPGDRFAECDALYATAELAREEYWEAMVRITMRALNALRTEVNDFLAADNGTGYLKMAYEEVLYPVVFTGKKKYFGIPHLNEVNMRPKHLFVRGIDVVKQGQSGLARAIGWRVMWACVALDNARTVRQVVEDVLRDAVQRPEQWAFEDFVQTAAWKPEKNNQTVQPFIARMRALRDAEAAAAAADRAAGRVPRPALYELPEPGGRFSFIVARAEAHFDLRGRKVDPKKSDLMVFEHVARALGLEPDVAFYLNHYVVGLCARFIHGDPALAAAGDNDAAAQKEGARLLTDFVAGLARGVPPEVLAKRGRAYQRAYKRAARAAHAALRLGGAPAVADVLQGELLDFTYLLPGERDESPVDALWAAAGCLAARALARDGPGLCEAQAREERLGAAPEQRAALLRRTAAASRRTARKLMSSALDRREEAVRAALAARVPAAAAVAARYGARLSLLVQELRQEEHAAHPELGSPDRAQPAAPGGPALSAAALAELGADEAEALRALREAWLEAAGLQLARQQDAAYARHLAALRERVVGAAPAPSLKARTAATAAAAARITGLAGVVVPV